ncbi:hypothetical protein LJ781_001072 [Salmonella enterica]|nr:hypothetical protein [Salmonella enterica]EKK4711721.1 hypothetical protein [Salmonella enterica]
MMPFARYFCIFINVRLGYLSFDDATGTAKLSNGNGNLSFFVNDDNHSGVFSTEFGVIWGFDGSATLTKGNIPVARLTGLSGSTGNSATAVMSQKATTEAINGVKTTVVQSVGTSSTSVMSQKATTDAINTAASVGIDQLWHDVTAIRTVGQSYTNDKGRPIVVAMNVKAVPGGLYASNITVQGIQLTTGSNAAGEHRFISVIVPPGQTYVYNPLASSNFILLELY